jgi:S1-C subfamily serine protease
MGLLRPVRQNTSRYERCRLIVQHLLPVLLLALLVVISPVAGAAAPADVARFLFPKTVLLTMSDSQGRPLSIGSGLILRPGLVVTNFHVIEGSGSGVAKRIGDNTKYNVVGIVAKDTFRDLAILQINGLAAEGAELSQRAMIDIGETVFAVGNPRGLEGTFSAGIVSAHRNIKGLDLLQITAPISPGSSGGPIADERGEVVGLAVATFTGGQNLNFAVPARYIKRIEQFDRCARPIVKDRDRQHVSKGILPTGIAKRITGQVDPSTKQITTPISPSNQYMYDDRPSTKLEFRTLGFTMAAD